MKFRVALLATDDGCVATVPDLPGCWSEGRTEAEALANIRVAIEQCLDGADDEPGGVTTREVDVAA